MTINCHSTRKYKTGTLLSLAYDSPRMRVETWRHEAGCLPEVKLEATEVAVMLSGRLTVERKGDGRHQKSAATAGTFWLCPAGVHETDIVLSDKMIETVHMFLPPDLLGATALEELDIDPSSVLLDYAGGEFDPMLNQIATSFRAMSHAPQSSVDQLLADSLGTTLAAHLLRSYLARPAIPDRKIQQGGVLDSRRLKKVFDYVEDRIDQELSLRSLADEACLSPFHFIRAFHRSTGKTPYQYLIEKRIDAAKSKLRSSSLSLAQIASETGFSTQSGFTRTFKKLTGRTPGQFRSEG
ncbi:AraC family transcriptional regulator (plasmid) [Agrobacterium vitis]|nr:helix-turn-helix transcriptional regulator [Agrobacterium vitis]QZO07665.1 AraC family transcriptional regulator [Agrobacterium vitis]UJL91004.1 helix-turn-helix transcriptional regulator [Agrobacterium vitis]